MNKKRMIFLIIFLLVIQLVGCDGKNDDLIDDISNNKEEVSIEERENEKSGKSAYEVAVENGFSGTEGEWLSSLKGKDGLSFDPDVYSLWYVGEGKPDKKPEYDGILYLDSSDLSIYRYNETGWEFIGEMSKKEVEHSVTLYYSSSKQVIVKVAHGECTELPVLEEEGKNFVGWYTGEGPNDDKITSYHPILRDTVLYPKFDEVKYKINYFIEEKLFVEQEYAMNEKIIVPNVEDDDFLGWKDVPDRMPTEDIVVYAVLSGRHIVTFIDGEKTIKTQSVADGENAEAPILPEKEGYDFIGWDGNYENVTEDRVVTARYSKKEFTVTFLDGDIVLKQEKTEYGSGATAPTPPSKEGFDFVGWDTDFSCVKQDLNIKTQYREKENAHQTPMGRFYIVGDDLYFSENDDENGERVVLVGTYVESDLCESVLNDATLCREGWSVDMQAEVKILNLSDFVSEGRCLVPVRVLIGSEWRECFVEVRLNY